MRSNHYNLAHSLYRKNLVDSPTCICGEDDEDLNHVFWSCPRFADERTSMLTDLKKTKTLSALYDHFLSARSGIQNYSNSPSLSLRMQPLYLI